MKDNPSLIETPADIMQLGSLFQKSRIFLSACELEIFSALGNKKMSEKEISQHLHADAKATGRLMNALVSLGLLRKEKGLYSNSELSLKFLVKDSPSYISGIMHMVHLWDTWSHLTESVRKGRPAAREEINYRGEDWLKSFIQAMNSRGIIRARQVAPLLDFTGVKKMMDIGGGSGIFTFTFLKENKDMKAVIFDLPNVIPITKGFIEMEGMAGRVETMAGNYLKDDIGSGYDMIFLSAVIHSNSFDENKLLIQKCAKALNPGGRIAILDYVMNEERTEPLGGTIFSINMLVGTQEGDTYTLHEITEWIKSAGVESIEFKDAQEGSGLVIGRK